MKNEEMMWKMKKLAKVSQLFTLESMAFSLFAMVLIFGLGFIFPTINPYVVIKWIVYVTGIYFLFAIVGNWVRRYMMMRMTKQIWGEKETEVKVVKKAKVSKKSK
jgi:hypothetical protein